MQGMHWLRLAWRMFGRDWRAGELRLLIAALVIAVGATTAINFFTDRLNRALAHQSADLLGADLVLRSPRPVDPQWLEYAAGKNLRTAQALQFTTVALHGEKLQLASVNALGPRYPLRGTLRASERGFAPDAPVSAIPAPGQAWADTRLMGALGVDVGERIELGATQFTLTRVLTFEPGRTGRWSALAPRILINQTDIPNTQVVQPGSRVTYGYQFAGAEQDIQRYRAWLEPRIESSQRLLDARADNSAVGSALDRAERYLGLASLFALLLAGVAIAMGARRYSERHFDVSAMMRCLGATQNDIVRLYVPQLLVVALLASLAGCLVGWIAQAGIFYFLKGLLPASLPAPGFAPVAAGLLTGVITLAGFALPPVLRLKHVPPLRVLRRDLTPMPLSGWIVYGAALAVMVTLMWGYTGNWRLTSIVLAGTFGAAVVLTLLAIALLRLGRTLHRRVGITWRFGVSKLWRHASASVSQILAFGLTLMAMTVIALVRTDLVSTWEQQLPPETPNYFAFNILPADVGKINRFFATHGIPASQIYPMVRGRLVSINDVPVQEAVTEEARDARAIQRELNLTWSATLPPDNRISTGAWWPQDAGRSRGVSVEAELAERLGIKLGDALAFTIGGDTLAAEVMSLRNVQWDSFHPNFFMIFAPGTLDNFPATYLTSFHLRSVQKPLLPNLARSFPAMTVLEIDFILAQVRAILRQVTAAVEFVLLFVLFAGFAVLYAALQASLDERFYEGALLRVLGASRRQLRASQFAEFSLLGFFAGILAAVGTEFTVYLLYGRVLNLEYTVKWPVWLIAPLVGSLVVGVAGYWATRAVARRSPLQVLREI